MAEIEDIFVCSRLKEERARLGIGQDAVAETCEVSRKTVGRWESNIPIPSDKLGVLAGMGFDACYVVTGISAHERRYDRNAKTLELIEECAAALRIIERTQGLQLNDDKFGMIVRMLFEEYYDEFVGEEEPKEERTIDTERVVQLVRLAS